jgi:hypothetical protein
VSETKQSSQARWNKANGHKLRAHAAVRVALRQGKLKRGRCEVCGSFRVQAHHESYQPEHYLVVRWFCVKHHQQLHAARRRG